MLFTTPIMKERSGLNGTIYDISYHVNIISISCYFSCEYWRLDSNYTIWRRDCMHIYNSMDNQKTYEKITD